MDLQGMSCANEEITFSEKENYSIIYPSKRERDEL